MGKVPSLCLFIRTSTVIVKRFPLEDKINDSPLAISSVSIFALTIPEATCSVCKLPRHDANKVRFATADK